MISLDRYDVKANGEIIDKQTEKPVKIFKSNKYYQCCIFDENGRHVKGVHEVVAQEYCDDWFDGCVVHHKDGDTHNNNADNLECFSRAIHSARHQERKYYPKIMVCPNCHKDFLWGCIAQSHFKRGNYKYGPFCSKSCSSQYISKIS